MTGVGWAPAESARSRHSSCSSIVEAQAMWWTLPAPWTARFPGAVRLLELERLEQLGARLRIGAVGAGGVEAAQGDLLRHLRVVGDQRLVLHLDDQQLVLEALGVGEDQAVALAPRLGPL